MKILMRSHNLCVFCEEFSNSSETSTKRKSIFIYCIINSWCLILIATDVYFIVFWFGDLEVLNRNANSNQSCFFQCKEIKICIFKRLLHDWKTLRIFMSFSIPISTLPFLVAVKIECLNVSQISIFCKFSWQQILLY